ncbi:MAG: DUF4013 domain-containing protein [Vicinamibacteria bacterium]
MATPATPVESQYVDFGRAFQFFFEDPEWQKKTLMGSLIVLLSLVLVGIPILVGYGMAVLRRTARGEARPLPEWDDYGKFFMDGLQVIGLYLLYFVAAMLIPGAVGCLAAIVGGAAGDNGGGVAGLGIMFAYILMFLFILPLAVYFPAALMRMTMLERFSAGFEIRENIELIKRQPGNYFIALAIYLVGHFIANFAIYLCCLPYFPAAFWALCMGMWAMGEVVRRDPVLGGQTGYAQVFA